MTFKPVYFSSSDGLQLYARIYAPSGTPVQTVVCLAGLTRNARDFDALALRLVAAGCQVVAIDSRGRGASAYAKSADSYTIATEAQDVLSALAALGIEHAAFIGTSRGGLILHYLAGMRPTIMKAVVLNDVGPVIEPDGLMQIRSYLEKAPRPKNWEDAIAIQKAIHGKAFPVLRDEDWVLHAHAIYKQDGKGNIVADFDVKILQTLSGIQADTRLPAAWPQFAGLGGIPMMVVRGEHSRLLSQKTFEEMGKRHGNCTLVTAPGQGHAPMLHIGDLSQRIISFLVPER
ncbi:MAG: alpha/beta fold hydrolase [Rhizobiaceae bacterium]